MIRKLRAALDRLLEGLLVAVFAIMVISVAWQVLSRFVLGAPSTWTEEISRYSLIWLTVLGAAYLTGRGEHISMDFLYDRLRPGRQRLMRLGVLVAVFAFSSLVMVVGGGNLVYLTLHLGQLSPAMRIPLGFIYGVVPFSGLLMMFYCLFPSTSTPSP